MLKWTLQQLKTVFKDKCRWAKSYYIGEPAGGKVPASGMPAIMLEPDVTEPQTEDNQRERIYFNVVVWLVIDGRQVNKKRPFENSAAIDLIEKMEGGDKDAVGFGDDSIVAVLLDAKQTQFGTNWGVWEVGEIKYGTNERGEIHTREAQVKVKVYKLKTRSL